MQKSQKLENEYFSQTEMTAKELFCGPEMGENEIHGRAQDRFVPLHMAEASFSCAVRHWNIL